MENKQHDPGTLAKRYAPAVYRLAYLSIAIQSGKITQLSEERAGAVAPAFMGGWQMPASKCWIYTSTLLAAAVIQRMGYFIAFRYRKVTAWARLQTASGEKLFPPVPLVIPFCTAQLMAFA